MKYENEFNLKSNKTCLIRNAKQEDGAAVLDLFLVTHEQTDYLASYADENTMTIEGESDFLQKTEVDPRAVELLAVVDGNVVGIAGIHPLGAKFKVSHRADLGISVVKEYWGQGIGTLLTNACIDCARNAAFTQLELEVVSNNENAIQMYKKAGFTEYGRNPRGFKSKYGGYQELVAMRLELEM